MEDYFYIHGVLPNDYSDIRPFIQLNPKDFQPDPGSRITMTVTGDREPDSEFGGMLPVVRWRYLYEGKVIESSSPVDLRPATKIWKPRPWYATTRNASDSLAYSIFNLTKDNGPRDPGTLERAKDRVEPNLQNYMPKFLISVDGDVFTLTSTELKWKKSYPFAGPKSVNKGVQSQVNSGVSRTFLAY